MKKSILFLCFICFLTTSSIAQVDRLVRFTAELSGESVIVTWVVGAGSTCQEVVVQRSLDSINFKDVYIYPTICGDSDEPVVYNWIDRKPTNYSLNYYRMKIEGVDFTEAVKVDYNSKVLFGEINLFPNPVDSQLEFWFENNQSQQFQFRILSYSGNVLFFSDKITGQKVTFDASFLQAGVYIVELKNIENSEVKTKKFVKL
jgi:hypothetical protein